MTLPAAPGPISLGNVNVELYRTALSTDVLSINMDDYEIRRLASTDNTGQSLTSQTPIDMAKLLGHARYNRNFSTWVQNPDIVADATGSGRYSAGKTWVSYTVLNGGVIGSVDPNIPSVYVPNFARSGDIVDIIINSGGYIVGAGGDGGPGDGGDNNPVGDPGGDGGTAILLNAPTNIITSGAIGGGGGGGGGGDNSGADSGGGGGGGAGFNRISSLPRILGGRGGDRYGPNNLGNGTGNSGLLLTGGAGGEGASNAGNGGPGGNIGAPGSQGGSGGKLGGVAGIPIYGTNYLTTFTNTGILYGFTWYVAPFAQIYDNYDTVNRTVYTFDATRYIENFPTRRLIIHCVGSLRTGTVNYICTVNGVAATLVNASIPNGTVLPGTSYPKSTIMFISEPIPNAGTATITVSAGVGCLLMCVSVTTTYQQTLLTPTQSLVTVNGSVSLTVPPNSAVLMSADGAGADLSTTNITNATRRINFDGGTWYYRLFDYYNNTNNSVNVTFTNTAGGTITYTIWRQSQPLIPDPPPI